MLRLIRPGPRGAIALLAALATIAVAGSALATTAGTPGRWTVVTRGPGGPAGSASDLGLARTPDGALHVAWKERTGPSTEAIRHRAISASGAAAAIHTVVAGWAGVSDPELVVDRNGAIRIFFGGGHSTSSSDPLAGLLTSTAPASGASWSAPAVVLNRNFAGARTPSATVTADGTPFQSWYGASEIQVHRGLTDAEPDHVFSGGSLSQFGPGIVDDAAGRLWVSWCAFGRSGGGLFLQRADARSGAPAGPPVRLPGSTSPYGGSQVSTCNLERTVARRTPMVARVGGGVFVAGSAGYPALSKVLVWRVDPSGAIPRGSFLVASDKAIPHYTPMLAAAPDGRVWVAWLERGAGGPRIAARRSNRLGTEWGEPVRVRAPRPWSIDALNVSAQASRLDVLGLMGTVGGDHSVQHTQLLPGLTVRRATTTRTAGRVTIRFRVSDAGDPVAGARVALSGGRGTAVTGANGIAAFANASPGTIRATATKAGYVGATTSIRCC